MCNKEYNLSEAAQRLAELRGKKDPYTREYMYLLIKEGKLNCSKTSETGTMYVTTESDLVAAAAKIKRKGRPPKKVVNLLINTNIDNEKE